MKEKSFSKTWVSSCQPRKQRKYRHSAPLHLRHKFLGACLDKVLRKQYNRRSLSVRRGDEVKIMRGEFRGRRGNVMRVDMKRAKVYIENVKKKKPSGREVEVPVDPSNLMIMKPNLDDKKRKKIIERVKKA